MLFTKPLALSIPQESCGKKLDRKYIVRDAGTKNFVVGKFSNFNESTYVMSQVLEFNMILHELEHECMKPN